MRLTGALYDANNEAGASGQVLTSTGTQVDWITLPAGVSGSGLLNKLSYWTGSGTLGYNNNLHWDNTNGRLGIGTSSPTQPLHVGGNMRLTGALYDANNEAGASGQVLTSTGTQVDWITLPAGVSGSGLLNKLSYWTGSGTLGYNNNLHWDNTNGRLGIGTSSPTQPLHVGGNMRLTGALYDANNEAGASGQILSTTGTGVDWIANPSPAGSGAANKVAFWTSSSQLSFNNNLHWDNTNGRLGIGDDTPDAKLSIEEATAEKALYLRTTVNSDGNVGLFSYHYAYDNASNFVAAVYGKAYGNNQPNSFGIAGHNYYLGTGIGAWSYSGDIYRGYDGDWPGGTLRMYLNNAGTMYVDGTYNTFKGVASKGPNEHVALIGTQSPEALVEDCGSATLIGGQAVVTIDPVFVEIANTGNQYQVFLTPVSEDIVILVVNKQSAASFMVKGATLDGKPAECKFHYRIVARDNEYKGGRFEEVDIPEPIVVPREE
jgi:hypothetical protein